MSTAAAFTAGTTTQVSEGKGFWATLIARLADFAKRPAHADSHAELTVRGL